MIEPLLLLSHLLILVYWLGGDLGAFYAAGLVTDTRLSAEARLTAARVLNTVDMAPATCLVLALPTGALLASARQWWPLPFGAALVIALAGLAWLAVVWRLHLTQERSALLRGIDRIVRWGVLAALVGCGAAGLLQLLPLPLFIALKCLVLAGCIGLGLLIRSVLGPYVEGFLALAAGGTTPAQDQGLRWSLARAKPMVLLIWALMLVAAWLGLTHVA